MIRSTLPTQNYNQPVISQESKYPLVTTAMR